MSGALETGKLTEIDGDGMARCTKEGARLVRCNAWDVTVGAGGAGQDLSVTGLAGAMHAGAMVTPGNVREREREVTRILARGGGGDGGGGDDFADVMEWLRGGEQSPTVAACAAEAAESMTEEQRAQSCHFIERPRREVTSRVSFAIPVDDNSADQGAAEREMRERDTRRRLYEEALHSPWRWPM